MATLIVNQSSGPYYTIQSAVDVASPFDVILVDPGTYSENVIVYTNNIRIKANGDGVILRRSGSLIALDVAANYVVINGFTIMNCFIGVNITGSYNNITRNTIITNISESAIKIQGDYNDINLNTLSLDEFVSVEKHVVSIINGNLNNISRNKITVPLATDPMVPPYGIAINGGLYNTISRNEIDLLDKSSYAFLIENINSNTISRNIIS